MNLRDIAIKAAKNTATVGYMPLKAGADGARNIGHQIIDPYSPSNILRQFKYQTGLAIVENLFKSTSDALWGKETTPKVEPTSDEKKTDEAVLLEVRNTNVILGKVTSILESTHEITKSLFGLELKVANDNKNKKFDNLEKYREGKNFNVAGMLGVGQAANGNTRQLGGMNPNDRHSLGDDIATGIGAGIGSRLAIGAIAGAIGGAIIGAIKNLFNIRGLMQAFTKTGFVGRMITGIGTALVAGIGGLFSVGKLLPLLSKLAIPLTIATSIGAGIIDGWNAYMETGDLANAISTGLTSSLDFLTFGLFSAIKDAAGNWLTGNQVVSIDESNAKIDAAREKLINGEISQADYDAAMKVHEDELKRYDEFMAPVNNMIAAEQLGIGTPPVINNFGNTNDIMSPSIPVFSPIAPIPSNVEDAGGTSSSTKIVVDGAGSYDPSNYVSPSQHDEWMNDVTGPNITDMPAPRTSPTVLQNNTTNNVSNGGSGTSQYRHAPVSTSPNHQSKWERTWVNSD